MNYLTANQIREKFLEFFKLKQHDVLPSSSLLPENDPSVLFTTAGMQQFKRYYSEPREAPSYRIANCQKCVRTGDIEEVGDETHLTFFEMLGNFSFGFPEKPGSYFKKEAIEMAWEFLTKELSVSPERISCTYFAGDRGIPEDAESKKLLNDITGLPEAKILGTDFSETFWSLGTEGSPGGPTVEFYIDGVEIWNLVFNEYRFENGQYIESEFKGVDTGMGFERLVAKINDVNNIYETDLFESPYKKLKELSKIENPADERIVLDHIRSAVFIINQGIEPGNKGQDYVLRRLIRRAVVKGRNLGIEKNFTSTLAESVVETYPSTGLNADVIKQVFEHEEEKFRKTLEGAVRELDKLKTIDANALFDLFQTYGLPFEISLEELKKRDIKIEPGAVEEFEKLIESHKELSRSASAGMFKGGLAGGGEMETKYHTATHLLLAALRQTLGPEIYQRGSNITAERLRFDFNYPQKLTEEQIKQVEDLVNEKIKDDLAVEMKEISKEEALKVVKVSFDPSKYPAVVKVYSIDDPSTGSGQVFSSELCGGPHVKNTGELGHFEITKEEASSAGVRRIKAVLKSE